jgi:hypothetical protein
MNKRDKVRKLKTNLHKLNLKIDKITNSINSIRNAEFPSDDDKDVRDVRKYVNKLIVYHNESGKIVEELISLGETPYMEDANFIIAMRNVLEEMKTLLEK